MLERVSAARPEARLNGFVLQAMISRPGAVELLVGLIDDPIYLEEPYIFSVNFALDVHTQLTYFPCTVVEGENITREVPHALPGEHPYLTDWIAQFGVPLDAARGRRETLYPEYQQKLRSAQAASK